jgi:hypothetical protein
MTLDQLSIVTRTELARLHPLTKREVMAYLNNKFQIVIGRADGLVQSAVEPDVLDGAIVIGKTARVMLVELETLLGNASPDGHLGATKD